MNGASGAAAAAAAAAKAIRASGSLVRVEPSEFRKLLGQNPDALVVHARGGLFWNRHRYLMGFKGLVFHVSTREPIPLSGRCQVVEAKRIWVP